ncbi:uncharacterized protein LOC133531015 isoform X1 [Cydia pomonella]|uniref:uncharacterized protein LOC133531015 isoform X1 n=1 Tax=Cydia pomonella TaxID=82600 RepID=UPI002ADDCE2D|nr:uncharacterized protein LOC133531015 isoform X1 [Cydia pomonella]
MDEGLVDNCCYCISLRTGCIIIAWLAASALIVGVGYHYFGDFDMFEDFWWVFLIIYFPALFEVINSIVFLCCLNAYEEFAKFYFMEACVVKLAMDLALAMFFIVLGCGDPDEPWTLQAINYYAMGIAVFYTCKCLFHFRPRRKCAHAKKGKCFYQYSICLVVGYVLPNVCSFVELLTNTWDDSDDSERFHISRYWMKVRCKT